MPALEQEISQFDGLNTQVLGISVDSHFANRIFAQQVGVKSFPLLSDLKRDVTKKYGVLRPDGFSERCTFLIDREGVVRWKQIQPALPDQRKNQDFIEAIKAAQVS